MKYKFLFSLILSLIIVFSGTSVFASTIFSENFESYNIGDGQSVLRNTDKWYYFTFNSFRGTVSSDWYSSPNQSFYFYRGNTETRFDSNILDTPVSVGSFFYTINQTGHSTNGGLSFSTGIVGTPANPTHSFGIRIPQDLGIIQINDETNIYTYPFYFGVDYNFRFDVDFINDKYSIFINNDLVADNVSFVTPQSFTSISYFSLSLSSSKTGAIYYVDDIYLTDGSSPFVVNGSCGSSSGGSFSQIPSTDLCSSGTLDFGVVNDGETFVWSCAGSGGGTNEYCYASVRNTTAQCGYSNGSVALTEPYGSHACLSGTITDMTQNSDNSWSWKCETDSTDFVFCNTMASAPVIPGTLPSNDSISCSISVTDLSTFADCLGSVLRWAFLPHQDTLNSFYSIPQTLASKSPFGYFYSISDELRSMSYDSPQNVVFTMKSFDSSDVVLLDVNSFKTWAGPEAVDFYFNIVRALLWISFLIWVFNKGRNIFSSNDNEK